MPHGRDAQLKDFFNSFGDRSCLTLEFYTLLLCVHKGFASELGQPEDSEEEEKEGDFQINLF